MPLLRSRVLRPLVLVAAVAVVVPLCGFSPASAADEGQSVVGGPVEDQANGGAPAPAVVQPEASASASVPTNEVTVVMAVSAGGTRDLVTLANLVAVVNGPVAQFWSEQSHGSVRIQVTDQLDWPAQPYSTSCADPEDMLDEAQAKSGFVPGPGKHLLVYATAALNCSAFFAETGSGTASGGRMVVRNTSAPVVAHVFGNNFGLRNAAGLGCDRGIETGRCSKGSDLYDVMGNPQGSIGALSPMEAAALGFLDPGPYTVHPEVEGSSYQSLKPYGDLANGDRTLRLVGSGGSVYWLEYRTPVGQDAWLADPRRNQYHLDSGVLIRREGRPGDPDDGFYGSLLLDATPSPTSFGSWNEDWQQALPIATPVRIDGGRISISVLADGQDPAAGVTLLVEAVGGAEACAVPRTPAPLSGIALLEGATTRALVVGRDRALWYRPVDGASAGWQSLGGAADYGPAAVRAGTTSYVFVVGLDHGLWYRSDSGSGWSPWTSLGGYLTASPASASLGSGQVRVFGRGIDGSLWSRELRTGAWSPWTGLGGNMTAPPTATADTRNGRIVVLVRGVDGYNWEQDLAPGSGPVPYQWVGIATCSSFAMGAVREGDNPMRGAYLDRANRPLIHGGGGSTAVGGMFTSNPAVTFFPGGDALVAGRGLDGALWVFDSRTPGGPGLANHSWQSLGGDIL